ncbi:MAG: thiol:disulfide interchange protein, partial [Deltaproteobacteria bacterium]|nr:thiol:disulfide interchange protein [Deltaproteobacteria bacterium]
KIFGSVSTSPIAMLIVGNIMILLGLGMLDVFILQIPSFLQPKQNQNQRSGLLGALIIGMVSGLVVAPCTAPPLGVLLTFAASKQNIFLGGLLLFVFAYGMGTLLILVGTFSGAVAVLPKSGKWMVAIKKSLAAVMLIIGEYFIFKAGQAWF